ncbi:MAG: acyl-CoA synthetase [Gammaproteobacteria bacterium]|nr:acyl-CoA synthetase [Gammaproteobacteria bacterium]NIR83020.1 acyl-CoA synthetase [Gammaproteobacteria bacterium]NIR90687.1 acyl-CoA synthetase [Gammaproteobacteria bacterium]NIU04175.1 acyl-CoA synthetase [Gammaproteobacteria bacterium]NIV51466.1 AMP-binding protein [Gammaproteobacteria bacterium]
MSRADTNPYEVNLDRNPANYAPLTPLTFIERAAAVYPRRIAVVHGDTHYTWAQTYARCRRLASALRARGIGAGDTVAVLAPNIPAIYESSFAVPMAGAVLNTINTRLDANTVAFVLDHGEAKALLADRESSDVVRQALDKAERKPLVVDVDDPLAAGGEPVGEITYEAFLAEGDPGFAWEPPADEWNAISLNYTSGTTGNPKGVVYHHRGAYLNALSNALGWNMGQHPVYLWTLPMFHCNGWCYPWTLAALAGTSICLRRVTGKAIFDAIAEHGVTHFCGAPVVLGMVLNAKPEERRAFEHTVDVMTAAAPPPASVLEAMEREGFRVTHVYGLTETYGPATICAWKPEWDELPSEERARLKARQGVRYHVLDGLTVMNPGTMQPVAADGQTMGEVMFRGNIVMKGYLKDPDATTKAFAGGWYHSGDLGVLHPDGYIQLKDRSKDIIISGGENISSIEVEDVLYRHPAVLEAAVVARPDDKWGETPCAFVALRDEAPETTAEDVIAFCRDSLAHFKVPKTVVFGALPKTSTGKIQKFRLREKAKDL